MNYTKIPLDYFDWSAYLASVAYCIIGCAGVPSNLLVMSLIIGTTELRTKPANWFIFNIALSDSQFALSFLFQAVVLHFPASVACKCVGFWEVATAVVTVFIPPLIALHRYVFLCLPPGSNNYSRWFTERNVIFMNIFV